MGIQFDEETLDRLRRQPPREAFDAAKRAVYGTADAGSEDFLNVWEQLVEQGILSRDQIEEFEGQPR